MESNEELTPYDLQVRQNIEENKKMLKSLGLLSEGLLHKRNKVSKAPRKIKSEKKLRTTEDQVADFIPKRYTRRTSSILKNNGYEEFDGFSENLMDEENTPPHKKIKLVREPVFGEIEGVNIGDWWKTRLECSAAGVHRPTVAGIHGKIGDGCYSIALSGGYEDDVDYGECFTYTGSGGRDLKGTKANPKNLRTGPQCKDQILDGSNAALESNIGSGKPIRVIRGYKLPSPYAPEEGYRYDGLYSVEKCWTATGLSGFKVYKFALKRLSNQDTPPWKTSSVPFSPRETNQKYLPETSLNVQISPSKSPIQNSGEKKPHNPLLQNNLKEDILMKNTSIVNKHTIETDMVKSSNELIKIETNELIKIENKDINKHTFESEMVKSSNELIKNENQDLKDSPKNKIDNSSNAPFMIVKTSLPLGAIKLTVNNVDCSNENLKNDIHHVTTSQFPEKNVRFSPEIVYTDVEKNGHIEDCDEEEDITNKLNDNTYNVSFDTKKQASILKYFNRVEKVVENHPPKNTVNPKSLRSNRFTSFSKVNLDSEVNSDFGNNVFLLKENNQFALDENSVVSNVSPNSSKPPGNGIKMSSSQKRKYSKVNKNEESVLINELSRNEPSMMENLIRRTTENLRLQHQLCPKEKNNLSLVRPCTVKLFRINTFSGWDCDDESTFCGFNEVDRFVAERKSNVMKKVSENHISDSVEKFHGWDSTRMYQGASGLVPLGFIIDELQKIREMTSTV